MGYLINPISFRLGWSKDWQDVWFSDNLYYTDFFYSVLKIRLFLTYFLNIRKIESVAGFYSHFRVVNFYNNISCFIYILNKGASAIVAKLQKRLGKMPFFFKRMRFYRKLILKKKYNTAWKLLILFKRMHPSVISFFTLSQLRSIAFILTHSKWYLLKRLFLVYANNLSNAPKKSLSSLVFLYAFFLDVRSTRLLRGRKKSRRSKKVVSSFIHNLVNEYWNNSLFKSLSFFLSTILTSLQKFPVKSVDFFALRNSTVTAMFLSRYMARKLKQNYGIWQLVNPLRREIRLVSKTGTSSSSKIFLDTYKSLNQHLLVKKSLYSYIFTFYTFVFRKFKCEFFSLVRSWLSVYELSVLKSFRSLIDYCLPLSFFFSITSYHIPLFLYSDMNLLNCFIISKNKPFSSFRINHSFGISFMNNTTFSSLSMFSMSNISMASKPKGFSLLIFFSNRFKFFNLWRFNYTRIFKFNRFKLKLDKSKSFRKLLGFKFHCSGRFSRKQRASSIWFRESKIPLNTINANIEYGFFTVPIRNSAVSIKIWLYRQKNLKSFNLKLT